MNSKSELGIRLAGERTNRAIPPFALTIFANRRMDFLIDSVIQMLHHDTFLEMRERGMDATNKMQWTNR